jgi:hypothetical protein
MVPHERVRVAGRCDLWSYRFVVGPERDSEVITYMNPGFDPRVKLSHRTVDFGEMASNLYFELGAGSMR